MPFCQQLVSCLKRGPQGCDWHRSREAALSLSAGEGSSWGSDLCSRWVVVPACHGQCSLRGWQEGLGVPVAIRHGPASLGTGTSLETCYQHAWQAAAVGTGTSAGAQSRKKMTRAAERRTGEGSPSALFMVVFSFLARKPTENVFWSPG